MKKDQFLFLDLLENVDDSIVYHSFLPWQNKKKQVIYKWCPKIACIILVFALIGGALFHTEVKAALQKVTTFISDILGIETDLSPYTEIKNIPITQNGLTLTLEEVILDNNELMILVSQNFENPDEQTITYLDTQLKINSVEAANYLRDLISSSTKIQDQKYLLRYYFDMKDTIPDPLDIEAAFKVSRSDNGTDIGNYKFHFTASREELETNTLRKQLNRQFILSNGATLQLTIFKWNPLESVILGKCNDLPSEYSYALKGTDNLGNQVLYSLDTFEKPKILFISGWDSYISPDASSLELQLCRRKDIILESIPSSDIDGYTAGGYISEPGEWEVISESFLISLETNDSE